MSHTFSKYYILILTIGSYFTLFSQNSIGLSGGYGKSKFTNLTLFKDAAYTTEYKSGNDYYFSGFYETTTKKLRFELAYGKQELSLDVYRWVKKQRWDMAYKNQFVKLEALRSAKIVNKPYLSLNVLIGLFVKYNVKTMLTKPGREIYQSAITDSSGNIYYVSALKVIEVTNDSKDFRPVNVGLETGLELNVPLIKKLDLIIQNRYNIDVLMVLPGKDLKYTTIAGMQFNIGLKYNLN